jgi:membrane protease subunit HflK
VLLDGRAAIAVDTQTVIQKALNEYKNGIVVTKVNLQDVNFPGQVEAAVQDAIKAREDKERLSFEAETYANDILPRARGQAVRQIQDAEGYKDRVIADAEGETSRFTALLKEYRKAPGVTRERLYIDAMEYVYTNSSKVLLDADGSGNLLYLPVDELMKRGGQQSSGSGAAPQRSNPELSSGSGRPARQDSRTRGAR